MKCIDCGVEFDGGPKRKRCDPCRRERKLRQQREAMRRSRAYIAFRAMRRSA